MVRVTNPVTTPGSECVCNPYAVIDKTLLFDIELIRIDEP
jgi:hypothetical protein